MSHFGENGSEKRPHQIDVISIDWHFITILVVINVSQNLLRFLKTIYRIKLEPVVSLCDFGISPDLEILPNLTTLTYWTLFPI